MSSAAIKALIDALLAKMTSLNEAAACLANARNSYSQFPDVLEGIDKGWANSIVIDGVQADEGKAAELAGNFNNIVDQIDSNIEGIKSELQADCLTLADLQKAYVAALEAERQAAEEANLLGNQKK